VDGTGRYEGIFSGGIKDGLIARQSLVWELDASDLTVSYLYVAEADRRIVDQSLSSQQLTPRRNLQSRLGISNSGPRLPATITSKDSVPQPTGTARCTES
jgi:hypothetical protein